MTAPICQGRNHVFADPFTGMCAAKKKGSAHANPLVFLSLSDWPTNYGWTLRALFRSVNREMSPDFSRVLWKKAAPGGAASLTGRKSIQEAHEMHLDMRTLAQIG